jgi:hypothetical protein
MVGLLSATSLGALAFACLCNTQSGPSESLFANDQLGSHFGLPGVNVSYDYVIVGGGTSGLALAYRLAENHRYSVAIIEAGSFYELDNGNLSSIPAQCANYLGSDPARNNLLIDWDHRTTPQPVGVGLNYGVLPLTSE